LGFLKIKFLDLVSGIGIFFCDTLEKIMQGHFLHWVKHVGEGITEIGQHLVAALHWPLLR
jgi:hypothetical protein